MCAAWITFWYEWAPSLIRDLDEGVVVQLVEFPGDDGDSAVAYYAFCHSEENNKFRPTTLKDGCAFGGRSC